MYRTAAFVTGLLLMPLANAAGNYLGIETGTSSGEISATGTTDLYFTSFYAGTIGDGWEAHVSLPWKRIENSDGSSASGIGDLVARGGFRAIDGDRFDVNAALAVKIPLADENKDLGTGQADIGGFVTLSEGNERLRTYLILGYISTGDSSTVDYNDISLVSLGLFMRLERSGINLALGTRTALENGVDDPVEVEVSGFRILTLHYVLTASAFVGLTDGGPDHGATFGLAYWY